MKRALFAIALLVSCSEQVPLGVQNSKCEYDEQCSQGYACKCIRRRNPDEEGPDEILSPGFCTTVAAFKGCPSDAGVTDTAFDAPPAVDTEPLETAADAIDETTSSDASDGG
jgi:hypothetical protein